MTNYVMNPLVVFQRFINYRHRSREFKRGFEAGCMGMALELITVVKTLEALPGDIASREETISTIHTFLSTLELSELSEEWYNRIAEARRLHFVAEPSALLEDTDGASLQPLQPQPDPASSDAYLDRGQPGYLGTPAQPGSDQSPDLPSSELVPRYRGGEQSRRIGSPLSPDGIVPPADESE